MSKISKFLLSILIITVTIFGQDPELLLNEGRLQIKDGNISEAESFFTEA